LDFSVVRRSRDWGKRDLFNERMVEAGSSIRDN